MGLLAHIAAHAGTRPQALALIDGTGAALDYGTLNVAVASAAAELRAAGIGRTDRVVLAPQTDAGGIVLLLALIDTATCCPVNPGATPDELLSTIEVIDATAVASFDRTPSALLDIAARQRLPLLRCHASGADEMAVRLRRGELRGPAPYEDRIALMLRTSGTSGESRVVPLNLRNIVAGAQATAAAYALTEQDRRLNVMPLFHVQGLVGSLIATLVSGGSILCLDGFEPRQVLASLATDSVTWFSATPTMHRVLLDADPAAAGPFPTLRFVRCGSAALPGDLRLRLEAAYGVPVVESYGMSEAHQIASTPMRRERRVEGLVPTGSAVAVLTEGRIDTACGSEGEVVISGANVVRGYYAGADDAERHVDGWLRTGDYGRLALDGSLVITGRLREMINRGGEKIAPREIEELLTRHPAVGEAVVFGFPHPLLDEQVGAAVVLTAGATATGAELLRWLSGQISSYKLPVRVLVRAELPTNATGKLQRAGLAEHFAAELAEPPDERPEHGAPVWHDGFEAALAGLWSHALGASVAGRDDDFFLIGGDSLSAIRLSGLVEDVLGAEITMADLADEAGTIATMSALVQARRAAGSGDRWTQTR